MDKQFIEWHQKGCHETARNECHSKRDVDDTIEEEDYSSEEAGDYSPSEESSEEQSSEEESNEEEEEESKQVDEDEESVPVIIEDRDYYKMAVYSDMARTYIQHHSGIYVLNSCLYNTG